MAITRVDPPFHVDTPLGPAEAHFICEMGREVDIQWGCFLEATGECWWWPNNKIRLLPNISSDRFTMSEIHQSPQMKDALKHHLERQERTEADVVSANARLSAAAQDMLEALKATLHDYEMNDGFFPEDQVRAAIAKATGVDQ